MENNGQNEAPKKGLWKIIDSIEGDKVIWIIVLLLILISVLAIFSSTSLLSDETRIDIMKNHAIIAMIGLALIFIMYKWMRWIGVYRFFSQFGFLFTFSLLLILDLHLDLGFIKAQELNSAYRTLGVFGLQIHVFEVAKVAMVMYLAWALHSYKLDCEAMENGEESRTFGIANGLARNKSFEFLKKPFWKRVFYIYAPSAIICAMILPGSNSSAIFMAIILVGTMMIGGVPFREILLAIVSLALLAGLMVGIHKATDGKFIPRLETLFSRMEAKYDTSVLEGLKPGTRDFFDALDEIRQPYGAKIAIHEGGVIGKGSGNSTQKYSVTHIYSDFMYSFLIEEYGLILGGIFVLVLYISLIARSSVIARLCRNEFAKITVGGLAFLITGQAILHMLVNVGIIPMTGQTLPLISDGASAFLVFCFAFGIILSISRMAKKKLQSLEESVTTATEDIQEKIDDLQQIEDEHIQ